jgi:DNA-binding phage protein
MVTPDDIRDELLAVGLVRTDARQQEAEAMTALTGLLRLGKEAGLTVTDMATLAGLTRETVYQALRSKDDATPFTSEEP